MSTDSLSNTADILDGRDVVKRFEELESERDALEAAIEDAKEAFEGVSADDQSIAASELNDELTAAGKELEDWDEDWLQEMKDLEAFIDEDSSGWRHGKTLIRERYFETYARQFAEDVGAISRDDKWPATCIDWEQAAEELKMDYTSADFAGVTYYYLG